jgi:hypothetical protein
MRQRVKGTAAVSNESLLLFLLLLLVLLRIARQTPFGRSMRKSRTNANEGISVEELKRSADFDPYFNLKVVLIEEGGELKVSYFEFLPPSMMD